MPYIEGRGRPRRRRAHHGRADVAASTTPTRTCASACGRSTCERRRLRRPATRGADATALRVEKHAERRSTGPTRRPRSWPARTSRPPARSSPRTGRARSTCSASRASSCSTRSTTAGCYDWEHGGDLDLAYGAARAHNRGMVEFCSVDPRLLPTCYVPLADFDRAGGHGRRGDRRMGAAALLVAVGLPDGPLAQPHRRSTRCGRRRRRPASRSCSTSAAPATCSTRRTSATAAADPARLPRRRRELPLRRLHGDPRPARRRRWPR